MVTASVGLGGALWCGCVSVWLKVGSTVGLSVLQLPMLHPWMVMGLGICIQSRGLRGSGVEGPMQDTARDWIPYPQGSEHCRQKNRLHLVNRTFFYKENLYKSYMNTG